MIYSVRLVQRNDNLYQWLYVNKWRTQDSTQHGTF